MMQFKSPKQEDEAFLAWIREQPSCMTGKRPCEPAHVRRANNSGIGIKPLLSAVPLTAEEHHTQHQNGELASLLKHCLPWRRTDVLTVQDAKDWFDMQVNLHLIAWRRGCTSQR